MDKAAICEHGWNLMAVLGAAIIKGYGSLELDVYDISERDYRKLEKKAAILIPYNCTCERWTRRIFNELDAFVQREANVYLLYTVLCRLCQLWPTDQLFDVLPKSFDSLNSNADTTRILVVPKMPCSWAKTDENRRSFDNYFIIPTGSFGSYRVKHHILDRNTLLSKDRLRIAFSPIGKYEAIVLQPRERTDDYMLAHNSFDVMIKEEEQKKIGYEMSRVINSAVRFKTDIILMPEILSSPECTLMKPDFFDVTRQRSEWLRHQITKAVCDHSNEPASLCILPEWKNGTNVMHIFDGTACLLATQQKHHPYMDKRNNAKENLMPSDKLLHMFHIMKACK